MRGRNQLDAASGTMPRWENTKPNRAASGRCEYPSQAAWYAVPTTEPLTAAITGFSDL